ncbi:MAG: hypothetical protein R6W67_09385, partial [Bacteroidales bacterium]
GGAYHTCVRPLLKNVVRCWGRNNFGQLGDGTTSERALPITVSPVISSTDEVSKVALGYYHTCVLLGSGTVRCWGKNQNGELGRGGAMSDYSVSIASVTNLGAGVKDIVSGGNHSCAILSRDQF